MADFNGDGKPDLAVANAGDNTVSVLLNTTAAGSNIATFSAPIKLTGAAKPYSVTVGDFNGDGKPDLAVADYGSNSVSIFLNTTPYRRRGGYLRSGADFFYWPRPRCPGSGRLQRGWQTRFDRRCPHFQYGRGLSEHNREGLPQHLVQRPKLPPVFHEGFFGGGSRF